MLVVFSLRLPQMLHTQNVPFFITVQVQRVRTGRNIYTFSLSFLFFAIDIVVGDIST